MKARALYELIGPQGAMLIGIPEIDERLAEIATALGRIGE